jgi:hypothetical protein
MVFSLPANHRYYTDEMKRTASNDIIGNCFYRPHTLFRSGKRTMQNNDPNADRHITIARACLKAINDTAADAGSREEKIQAVYEAIDKAFKAELSELSSELSEHRQAVEVMGSVLERIASGQLDAQAAASLASKTLDQQPEATRNNQIH